MTNIQLYAMACGQILWPDKEWYPVEDGACSDDILIEYCFMFWKIYNCQKEWIGRDPCEYMGV